MCTNQNGQLTQTVTVLLSFAMIWLKVKLPILKLVVTIYCLSFLWPLKHTVHFFYHLDNVALPFFHPMSFSMIVPAV